MDKLLRVSYSPHIHGENSVPRLMWGVIASLVPAFVLSVLYFGLGAILVTATSVLSCVLFEYLIQRFIMKVPPTVNDGSAVVTGVLLAFCLPATIPLWLVALGALVAIGVGKMSFGGLGSNPFNPALVGRVFLFISFPVQLTSWPLPMGFKTKLVDAATGATPLGVIKEGLLNNQQVPPLMDDIPSHMQLFYGNMNGSMGEVAAMALLLGFIYMVVKKIIPPVIPLTILGTVFVFTGILWLANPESNADPLFHLLTGGVMLGAIYMATDYVTSPMTKKGMVVFGVGIGVITVLIRRFGSYPEGVQFAILIMNAFVPLINSWFKPKRFGEEVQHG
ncbi:MAG TPA: RnfABCDGE type electron transport complex subunit D [Bacteroidetes bacterium]|nr:RnfABCDGE type electron transport complex subunit D [Bacteroidota bacterium]